MMDCHYEIAKLRIITETMIMLMPIQSDLRAINEEEEDS